MAVRNIVEIGHPILRVSAKPIDLDQLATKQWQQFIDDLIETMRNAKGAGLAANQVGEAVQICVLEVKKNPRYPYKPDIPLTVLVNPKFETIGDDVFDNYEGCLSVPNLRGVVKRHARLRVDGFDRYGQQLSLQTAGVTAGTYQHEIDHLHGVLFIDRVVDSKTLCTWHHFKEEHEAKFAASVLELVKIYGS